MYTSPPADRLEVSQHWVDQDGELTFLIRHLDDPYAQVWLSRKGEWSAYLAGSEKASDQELADLKKVSARYLIDRAFGGKSG